MRIGLVGCVKQKEPVACRAEALYRSTLFRGRRTFVERTCDRWFILSALHGLLDPDEVIEPYGLTQGRQLAFYRDAATATGSSAQGRDDAPRGLYEPLGDDLRGHPEPIRDFAFDELEQLIGTDLPTSARRHRAWWANDHTHSQGRAWMAAGWKVASVDLASGRVTFQRSVGP